MTTCPHCLRPVGAYAVSVGTVQVAQHMLSTGARCPGSGSIRQR